MIYLVNIVQFIYKPKLIQNFSAVREICRRPELFKGHAAPTFIHRTVFLIAVRTLFRQEIKMKRSSFLKLSSTLLISMAVLIVGLGIGNHQTATAASLQSHDEARLDPADASAYRWESAASYFVAHQVWPVSLTSLNAADISAYRWDADAAYYVSHQIWAAKDLTFVNNGTNNSNYRLIMVEPGFWARQESLPK